MHTTKRRFKIKKRFKLINNDQYSDIFDKNQNIIGICNCKGEGCYIKLPHDHKDFRLLHDSLCEGKGVCRKWKGRDIGGIPIYYQNPCPMLKKKNNGKS